MWAAVASYQWHNVNEIISVFIGKIDKPLCSSQPQVNIPRCVHSTDYLFRSIIIYI